MTMMHLVLMSTLSVRKGVQDSLPLAAMDMTANILNMFSMFLALGPEKWYRREEKSSCYANLVT